MILKNRIENEYQDIEIDVSTCDWININYSAPEGEEEPEGLSPEERANWLWEVNENRKEYN